MSIFQGGKPDFDQLGQHWPNSEHSQFVVADGLKFHVQIIGQGPACLLLHGTGASCHSFAELVPFLSPDFTLIIPDLPGHAFTATPPAMRLTLAGMARGIGQLLEVLALRPEVIIGHSAGAAIGLQMLLDGAGASRFVSINGALFPFGGVAFHLFSPMAKMLSMNPFFPGMVARRARDKAAITRLIEGTGSYLDDAGIVPYQTLFQSPGHVAATIAMMANWRLGPLVEALPQIEAACLLLAGEEDEAIPPADAEKAGSLLPHARVEILPKLGHLAHEEAPDLVAPRLLEFAQVKRPEPA